jgi:DNA-binding PadR family transcriptional regulator
VISLNGGTLGDQKLERYLARMNADQYTPIDKTEKLLQRLCKEGYIVKTREMDGGEEIIEYTVGPRGKVEVGSGGVAGLTRSVYGVAGTTDEAEFEAKLRRSLGIVGVVEREREEDDGVNDAGAGAGTEFHDGEERVEIRRSRRGEREESSSGEEEDSDSE